AFQGGAWGYLGPKGGASVAQAWYTRLEYAADGALFLACRDYGLSGRINVRRYLSGSNQWQNVGLGGASAGDAHWTDLATGPQGDPFVIYADHSTQPADRASAQVYRSGAWHSLGGFGISPASASFTSIAVGPQGDVWCAFADQA